MSDNDEWKTVLDAVEQKLLTGVFKPGSRLPSERAMAAELHVQRSAVHDAVRVLEVLGAVNTGAGAGLSSAGIIVAAPTGGMSTLLRLQAAAQAFPLMDIERTRLVLEEATVKDLSTRYDTVDLSEVIHVLDTMDDPQISLSEYQKYNGEFHISLARASGNQVVTDIMTGLHRALEVQAHSYSYSSTEWHANSAHMRDEHRSIFQAITERNGASAAELMRSHILDFFANEAPPIPPS